MLNTKLKVCIQCMLYARLYAAHCSAGQCRAGSRCLDAHILAGTEIEAYEQELICWELRAASEVLEER